MLRAVAGRNPGSPEPSSFGITWPRAPRARARDDRRVDQNLGEQGAHDAHPARSTCAWVTCGRTQSTRAPATDLEIRLDARMAVNLGAELQRLARGIGASGSARFNAWGRSSTAGSRAIAIEEVGVDTRATWGVVSARKTSCDPRVGRRGLKVCKVQRLAPVPLDSDSRSPAAEHHQFIAIAARRIEQVAEVPPQWRASEGSTSAM